MTHDERVTRLAEQMRNTILREKWTRLIATNGAIDPAADAAVLLPYAAAMVQMAGALSKIEASILFLGLHTDEDGCDGCRLKTEARAALSAYRAIGGGIPASAEGKEKITDHKFEPMLGGVCRAFVGYDTETGYAYCFEPEAAHADTQEPDQKRGE